MVLGIGLMAVSVAAFREPSHAVMGLGMSVVFVGAVLRHRTRRAAAPSAEALLQDDTRPPVLYLRSYADEAADLASDPYYADESLLVTFGRSFFWSRFSRRRSLEETFADRLGRLGPVVAIGSPKDKTKILGAARLSIDPSVWKETVLRLLRESRLVIMRIGQTPGVMWEMEQAARIVPPERLVLYADFARMAGEGPKRTAQRRAAFQEATKQFLREEIPLATLRRRFITFASDGRTRGTNSLTTMVRRVQGKRGPSPARIAAVAVILLFLAPIPWMFLGGRRKPAEPLVELVVVEPKRGAFVPTLDVRVTGRAGSPGFHAVLVNGTRATLKDGAFEAVVRAPGEGSFPIEVRLVGRDNLRVDRTVIADLTAPELEIAEPSARDVTMPPGVTHATIRGHVRDRNPGAVTVTVDGQRSQASLDAERGFSAEVVLDEGGAATVVVVADDLAGNRSVPITLRFGRSK
jgi:hypothetical protein